MYKSANNHKYVSARWQECLCAVDPGVALNSVFNSPVYLACHSFIN